MKFSSKCVNQYAHKICNLYFKICREIDYDEALTN